MEKITWPKEEEEVEVWVLGMMERTGSQGKMAQTVAEVDRVVKQERLDFSAVFFPDQRHHNHHTIRHSTTILHGVAIRHRWINSLQLKKNSFCWLTRAQLFKASLA